MPTGLDVKVATEVWIAAALLHREHPSQEDFTTQEVLERAERENIYGKLRPGVYVHIIQHCVANRPPNPGRYRMLFETADGRRRLYRRGDPYDPGREGSKIAPERAELPEEYVDLLDWYHQWEETSGRHASRFDPLIQLSGSGREVWAGEPADEYVERLRRGWE